MKVGTECFETLAYKIQTLRNYPEESRKHTGHGESFKSRTVIVVYSDLYSGRQRKWQDFSI
jgi:hypothetical protein